MKIKQMKIAMFSLLNNQKPMKMRSLVKMQRINQPKTQ